MPTSTARRRRTCNGPPNCRWCLNTGRIRDQWHTMTRTGKSPRLTGHHPEPFVQLHPADAARCGVATGDLAEVGAATERVLARVDVTADARAGTVFMPMHWSAQFASAARVGALIAAVTDPVSGQPELKHTPVRVRRYAPAWYGFALSRAPLDARGCTYLARTRCDGFWRYELAGERLPVSWPDWADAVLGPRTERIELHDKAGGRYRGASVVGGRLQVLVRRADEAAAVSHMAGRAVRARSARRCR